MAVTEETPHQTVETRARTEPRREHKDLQGAPKVRDPPSHRRGEARPRRTLEPRGPPALLPLHPSSSDHGRPPLPCEDPRDSARPPRRSPPPPPPRAAPNRLHNAASRPAFPGCSPRLLPRPPAASRARARARARARLSPTASPGPCRAGPRRWRHVRGAAGPAAGEQRGGTGRERRRPGNRKGYTLRRCPMSWMRLAACWRYESSLSASTPQRRLGVFSSCSRVKNQREEAPRPDAMTLPPPPAPSPAPLPSRLADSPPRPRDPAPLRSP